MPSGSGHQLTARSPFPCLLVPPRAPPAPLACLPSPYQQPLRSPRLPRPGLHPSPASFPFAPKPPGPAHPLRSAPRHPVRLPCQPPSLTPLPQLRCGPPSRTPFPQLRFPRAGSPFHPVPPAATQLSRTRDAPFPLPMASHSCCRSNVLPSPNISATPPDPFAVCPCSFSCHPCPPSPPHPALLRPCRLSPAPCPLRPASHPSAARALPVASPADLAPCPHPSAFVTPPLAAVAILLNCPPRISLPSTRPPPPPPRSPQAAQSCRDLAASRPSPPVPTPRA